MAIVKATTIYILYNKASTLRMYNLSIMQRFRRALAFYKRRVKICVIILVIIKIAHIPTT